jgi:hypothetical protein
MRYLEIASSLDSDGDVVGAAWAYELALAQMPADIAVRLDLVAVYVAASDTGFAAAHHLDRRFVDLAYYRAKEVLEHGLTIHRDDPELRAWLHHLDERVLGDPVDDELLQSLAGDPRAEFARLLLYVQSDRREYRLVVEAMFLRAAAGRTTRERYYMGYAPMRNPLSQ